MMRKMKTNNKEHLQCGWEHKCKNKDCLKCPRKQKMNLNLSLAEQIVIEDFAMIDLKIMINERPKEIELMQNIMRKVMRKVFKKEDKI